MLTELPAAITFSNNPITDLRCPNTSSGCWLLFAELNHDGLVTNSKYITARLWGSTACLCSYAIILIHEGKFINLRRRRRQNVKQCSHFIIILCSTFRPFCDLSGRIYFLSIAHIVKLILYSHFYH